MYIIYISQKTVGGSNPAVRIGCSLGDSFDELGAAYCLYILDLVQTLFATVVAWTSLCQQWGNPGALMHTNWSFSMFPVISGASEWTAVLDLTFTYLVSFLCRSFWLGSNIFRMASVDIGVLISLDGDRCGDYRGAYTNLVESTLSHLAHHIRLL
jgi:hypothetical protein